MIYKGGKPTAVILPLAQYEELLERVEDAADLKWLRKTRCEGVSLPSLFRLPERKQTACIRSSLSEQAEKDLDRLSPPIHRRMTECHHGAGRRIRVRRVAVNWLAVTTIGVFGWEIIG